MARPINLDDLNYAEMDAFVDGDPIHLGEVAFELLKSREKLAAFARRLVVLDEPGSEERRRVTLNQIIGWAREALGVKED